MVVKVSSPVDAPAASAVESEGVPPAVLEGTDAGFVERYGTLRCFRPESVVHTALTTYLPFVQARIR